MASTALYAGQPQGPTADGQVPLTIMGTDKVVASPDVKPPIGGQPIAFRFEDAPIAEVANLLLRDVLAADYVLHPH